MTDAPPSAAVVAPLFQPLQVRSLHLANRIVMAPMTRNFCPRGVPGPNVADYYTRRAAADVGFIITEGVGVDHPAALGSGGLDEVDVPKLCGAEALAGWQRVVAQVHAAGGKIAPQLWHQGVMRDPGTGPHPEAPSSRPSGIWGPEGRLSAIDNAAYLARVQRVTPPMSESEIADVIAAYGRSAAHARELGFDAIAIHGGHGYLIDTFLWAETNRRTDRWGGDLRRRAEFAVEVVKAIRAAVGEALPVILRFSQWKQQDFKARIAQTPDELATLLGPMADAGVDVFDGSVRYFNRAEFPGSSLNLSGWARRLTGKLAITVGGVGLASGMYDSNRVGGAAASNNLALLMERFNAGEFDLVAVGRALLNDPLWARKLKHGQPQEPLDNERKKVLH